MKSISDILQGNLGDEIAEGEAAARSRIVRLLRNNGWHCEIEQSLDGRFRADVVIMHPTLPTWGAIECKATIREIKEARAALKQASDYIGRRIIRNDALICWAAVYPWQPPAQRECGTACAMWGMLSVMGPEFKVFAFIEDETYRRWQAAHDELQNIRHYEDGAIRLMMNSQTKIWCSSDSPQFTSNAINMIAGKRQIGGVRRHAEP